LKAHKGKKEDKGNLKEIKGKEKGSKKDREKFRI